MTKKLIKSVLAKFEGESSQQVIMNEIVKVSDIMTKKLITLDPDDGLDKATKLFEEYKYDGFPVVNKEGNLLGIELLRVSKRIPKDSLSHINVKNLVVAQ